ncbi:hypothetical protein [Spongiactinospora sp. TRM90649]|uniref:hypothetical protein n=1 Tax=Spongiactinospora sp. TRM90649 TaxID=3031114 RepID=UPI0023F657E4|nr:hypothetical protein [Spongiactinospora sp. TRM90649]MDF5757494.1 hypothetical protein [Spongiactinospora sp. TRM90649]
MRNRVGSKSCAALLAGWASFRPFTDGENGRRVPDSLCSVIDSRELLTGAIGHLLGFLRTETALFREILFAVPDAAAAKVGPLHRDDTIRPIIHAARHGWCGVFSDWLVPVVVAAHSPVQALSARELRNDADLLSDLVIRTSVHSGDGLPVRADALWGFWFQQCVVGRAGPQAEERERAEHEVRTGQSAGSPTVRLARSMLAGCQDFPATIDMFVRAAGESAKEEDWHAAADSLGVAGVTAVRFGDWRRAEALLAESGRVARLHLGEDGCRDARAAVHRAELLARSGRPDRALSEIRRARAIARPNGWTGCAERIRMIALAEHGHVALASGVRQGPAPDCPDHDTSVDTSVKDTDPDVPAKDPDPPVRDLIARARVLRQAGRPTVALQCLTTAERATTAGDDGMAVSERLEIGVERARCALSLVRPEQAVAETRPFVANWRWHARRISARVTFELLILSALAAGSPDKLAYYRGQAESWPGIGRDDQVFDEFGWAMAQTLRARLDLAGAVAELGRVRDAQARRIASGELFDRHPAVAVTRLEFAECAEAGDLDDEAAAHYTWIAENPVLDLVHPVRVAAVLGLVRLARKSRDHTRAAGLLDTLPRSRHWPLDPELEVSEEMTRLRRLCAPPGH